MLPVMFLAVAIHILPFVLLIIFLVKGIKYFNKKNKE